MSIQYNFDRENSLLILHSNVDKALKLNILASVDNIYTQTLKEKYVVYGNLSCLEVMTNLKSNYYKITPANLKDNASPMTSTYDVN